MKLYVDDIRPTPKEFDIRRYTVFGTIETIKALWDDLELISLDHDAGDFVSEGGDYIEILKWLEEYCFSKDIKPPFAISIHSGNPVGVRNMMAIIDRWGWTYAPAADEIVCDVII